MILFPGRAFFGFDDYISRFFSFNPAGIANQREVLKIDRILISTNFFVVHKFRKPPHENTQQNSFSIHPRRRSTSSERCHCGKMVF